MKKFKNEKLHNLHSSPSIISVIKSRRMRWTDHVRCSNEIMHTDVWSDSEERIWKKDRWEDSIKIDLKEMGRDYVGWLHLSEDGVQ
jgi:hypothetical protein